MERVEPIMSNLEKLFDNHPNFETVYRGSDGNYHPGPAEIITKTMVERLAPERFRQDVKIKLQHAGKWKWKNDPELVMDTVVVEAKEWRKIEALANLPPPCRNLAGVARNRQVLRRSRSVIGVAS